MLRTGALAALAATMTIAPPSAAAPRTLDEYQHFRALSIDLVGRVPTRAEIEAFEAPSFQLDAWIRDHLRGRAYEDRITRVYMDLLRLETPPLFPFQPDATFLKRAQITGPDGKPLYVFFRNGQRRARAETDGGFCLTTKETGPWIPFGGVAPNGAHPVSAAALDAATVLVRPWWLYEDYAEKAPSSRYGQGWTPPKAFRPIDALLKDPDGADTIAVRVCREEASTAATAPIAAGGRSHDAAYATAHAGQSIACTSPIAFTVAPGCGCGVGLETCLPGHTASSFETIAFALPEREPLSAAEPLAPIAYGQGGWTKYWWGEEARHLLGWIFAEDRDFREIVTGAGTVVNGPLAQFYRAGATTAGTGAERYLGMPDPIEPLFDPAKAPRIGPADVETWRVVPDRGAHAAGILTTPAFLAKFASRRARAAAAYTTFSCKSFTGDVGNAPPSTSPDLSTRPGCATCHATLEPLAAYFARVEETSWAYLPESVFPEKSAACRVNDAGLFINQYCSRFYDRAFTDIRAATLAGAYVTPEHAGGGPRGLGVALASSPDFARCAVERVASSFFGRALTTDDDPLVQSLAGAFTASGYKMRTLVDGIVRADAYAKASAFHASGEAPR